jgi:two-component system chemotaxis response regulator CheB
MRVLVVDDARMMRRVISDVIKDAGHDVVGEASNGAEAMAVAARAKPDLITLDIEMPGMSGLEALGALMRTSPTKVLLVSSLTTAGADVTLEGLALGAIDFVPKPSNLTGIDGFAAHLAETLAAVEHARVPTGVRRAPATPPAPVRPRTGTSEIRRPSMIVVASSTGGPDALGRFFGAFHIAPPAPMLVVQHMPPEFTGRLAKRLDSTVSFSIAEATNNERVQPGKVLIAPGDHHLGYRTGRVRLLDSPPIGRLRPAADITLQEVAEEIGGRTLVVVLSGMGRDGTEGAKAIVAAGGQIVAQDGPSCAVDGMPRSVREAGLVTTSAKPEDLAAMIEATAARGAA